MDALKIIGTLPFLLGFIVCMAVMNGQYFAMRLDLDPKAGMKPFSRDNIITVIRDYRRQFPEGRRHVIYFRAQTGVAISLILLLAYAWAAWQMFP